MQWKEMGWPILVDPINVTGTRVVPETWAIDEYGIVRIVNPGRSSFEDDFINQSFPQPEGEAPTLSSGESLQMGRCCMEWNTAGQQQNPLML